MKHRWRQKSLSLLLTAALLATSIPFSSFAGLTAQAAEPDNTETVTIEAGEHTLSDRTINGKEGSAAVIVKNGAVLTLKDVTVNAAKGQSAIYIEKNATLVIEGVVNATGGDAYFTEGDDPYGVYKQYTACGAGAGIEVPKGSDLKIYGGGTLHATGGNAASGLDGASGVPLQSYWQPCYWRTGKGGGGAGAGIGSRGAKDTSSTPEAGSITIDDDNILVYANGGKGGEAGGKGGDGGEFWQVSFDEARGIYILYNYHTADASHKAGFGGGGGGGAGYPGAGIGSGGAAGGDGGAGGTGGQDDSSATLILTAFYVNHWDTWTAGGGGGGGGGQGYINGGGGGAGESTIGELGIHAGTITGDGGAFARSPMTDHRNVSLQGLGGESGEDGVAPELSDFTYAGKTVTSAGGGTADGKGGAAGIGRDNAQKATAGADGGAAGKKASGGSITIGGGMVDAASGGEGAQHAGSGGGTGDNSGSIKILGGCLNVDKPENPENVLRPVNEKGEKLYGEVVNPHTVNTYSPTRSVVVTINGESWPSMKYSNAEGDICLWLPESPEPYKVILDAPCYSTFDVTVADGKVEATSSDFVKNSFNMYSAQLFIVGDRWHLARMGGYAYIDKIYPHAGEIASGKLTENTSFHLSWTYPTDIYFYNYCDYGSVFIYSDGRDYDLTLENCHLSTITVDSLDNTSGGTVNIESKGSNDVDALIAEENYNNISLNLTGELDSYINVDYLGDPKPEVLEFQPMKFEWDAFDATYSDADGTDSEADMTINSKGITSISDMGIPLSMRDDVYDSPDITINSGKFTFGDVPLWDFTVMNGTVIPPSGGITWDYDQVVAPGTNLILDTRSTIESPTFGLQHRLEIADLPANQYLSMIEKTSGEGYLGDFINEGIWTDERGMYVSFMREEDAGKRIIFADENGQPYSYIIRYGQHPETPSLTGTWAEKETLPELPTDLSSGTMHVYPKFIVYNDTLYSRPDGALKPEQLNVNIVLKNGAELAIETESTLAFNSSITGDGSLTLDGAGLKGRGRIEVDSLTILNGTVDLEDISCGSTQILGGSIRSGHRIRNTTNGYEPVYYTEIPLWSTDVKVDGEAYPVSGSGHDRENMYLYLPESAKILEVGGRFFYLTHPEDTDVLLLTEREDGDGVIDLSKSGVEILSDDLYIYDDHLYRNTQGKYTVTGEIGENGLTVSGGSPEITLKNVTGSELDGSAVTVEPGASPTITLDGVTLSTSLGSPVDIQAGASADIILKNENTLTAPNGSPAIRVPKEAKVAIGGTGVLNASGGQYAAAVGGGVQEENGTITITSGTFNLYGNYNAAVGAGSGARTPAGSIILTGGAVKAKNSMSESGFGTEPVNAGGEKLTRLIFQLPAQSVSIDGVPCGAVTANDDGMWYLYVLPQKTTITADGKDYLAMPLSIKEAENGSIRITGEIGGKETQLNTGDMVLEGTELNLTATPDEGYGLRSGPASGTYRAKVDGNELILTPVSVLPTQLQSTDSWEPVLRETENPDAPYEVTGSKKELQGETVLDLGYAVKGTAVAGFTASGSGITAELLVDGQVMKSVELSDDQQAVFHSWKSNGAENVKIRFSGKGTIILSSFTLGNETAVSDLTVEFDPIHTLSLEMSDENAGDSENEPTHFVDIQDQSGDLLIDRNTSMQGIQIFEDDVMTITFRDNESGSVFDSFTLTWEDGTVETKEENPLTLALTQDVTLGIKNHLNPYYVVVIPETVAITDEGASAEIKAASLKNMQAGDTLDVTISGLDEKGNAAIKRENADNTLAVPVTDGKDIPLVNQGLVAQFADNITTPKKGGFINFGAPIGDRKAGKYTGTVAFTIAYQTAGE